MVLENDERLGVWKSLLTAIPSRLKTFAETATVAELRALAAKEVDGALGELLPAA